MKTNKISLQKLIDMLMYREEIETVEFYNDDMSFLYSFTVSEIPLSTQYVKKFNAYWADNGKYVLEVVEA